MLTMTRTLIFVGLLAFGPGVTHGQEVMPERDQLNRLMPEGRPNPEQFRLAMTPGEATIRGAAKTRYRLKMGMSGLTIQTPSRTRRPVESQPVHLLPHNGYTQAWIDLYMSQGGTQEVRGAPVRTVAVLDPSVAQYRRTITSNSMGDFEFRNVQPGRYIVYAEPEWEMEGQIQAPRSQGGLKYGYVHTARVDFAYRVVDVPSATSVVEADIETQKVIYEKRIVQE